MTPEAIKQTMTIARWTIGLVFIQGIYSLEETVRHLILGDESAHILDHLWVGAICVMLFFNCYSTAKELFITINGDTT